MGLLRARTRPAPHHAARWAALAALLASAGAGLVVPSAEAGKKKSPVIKKVSPMNVSVGQKLTLKGKRFLPGRGKNTVVFKRDGARAVFVKADLSTRRMLRVTIPERLVDIMAVRNGEPIPTRFKLRVLGRKFGKRFTGVRLSPRVGPRLPALPPRAVVDPGGDCDGDRQINSADVDDDNDLLLDTLEKSLPYGGLDPCQADTDGDKIGDGYEFRSARDLNNDEYENLNAFVPYPGKRLYANPLDPTDAGIDFDGDSLTLAEEHSLWRYTLAHGSAAPTPQSLGQGAAALTYSDGAKHSIYQQGGDGRRTPALSAVNYPKENDFNSWLAASGHENVYRPDTGTPGLIRDFNRDGAVSNTATGNYAFSEAHYLDTSRNGFLADDERDEDADGLSNWDETHGRMQSGWWVSRYARETPFRLTYAGTDVDDADSDGDGVRDGADDQDHDDVPNIVELSRNANTGRAFDAKDLAVDSGIGTPVYGRVQPFNPCEPFINSRTCPTHVPFDGAWAPFDGPPHDPDGDDPNYLVLN